MGFCIKIGLASFVAAGLSIGYLLFLLESPPSTELPALGNDYWGPGSPKKDDSSIRPFTINVSDAEIEDLKTRLKRWRGGPEALEGVAFQYGFHKTQLKEIIDYWGNKYDWRQREKLLNSLPQYKTQISGLDIHFIHVKPDPKKLPKGVEVLPLLLLHGWPGSVKEFYKLIPHMVTPRPGENFVFEVIAPSLPGYGWSQGASKPGLSPQHIGLIMHKLMSRLGIHKFYVQGGDWGSIIGGNIALYFSESVIGFHTNMCIHGTKLTQVKLLSSLLFPWLLSSDEPVDRMSNQISHTLEETGYMHIQATKPDTVGAGLSDSPAGLAAYILEKFSTWTNPIWKTKPDGGLSNFQRDDLLDNIMIYWITNSITTSMRLYSENFNKKQRDLELNQYPITVPTGCARFPSELLIIPKRVIESGYHNLIRYSDMPKGGHFAAFEVPDLLAEDIWQFTAEARKYHSDLLSKQNEKKEL